MDDSTDSIIEYDVDDGPDIIPLDHSPKGHQTFQYKPLKSSGSEKSVRSINRSNNSVNNLNNTHSGINCSSKNKIPSQKAPQVRSKSVIIGSGGPLCSPDLSIRRIYAVRSLNDIVFSEEDYDFAAV